MTVDSARAFAPGNISCVFKIVPHEDPTRMHSLGMGFTVSEGVTAIATACSPSTVTFNGEEIDFPTVAAIVAELSSEPVRVELSSQLPLSSGFGLSGAATLATGYALNHLFDLQMQERELAMCAHVAEVENLTGLGDVCAQFHGGCLVKLQEGHPLAAERLAVDEQPVYYRYFSPIKTSDVLRDERQRQSINHAADKALVDLKGYLAAGTATLSRCVRVSKKFAVESLLMRDPDVLKIVQEVEEEGGDASMIMLGNAVFSNRPFAGSSETRLSRRRVTLLE